MLELEIQRECQEPGQPDDEAFRRWVSAAVGSRKPDAEVVIRLVSREEIQALNRDYRDKDSPTNVLSFVSDIPEIVESTLLGDIIICASVVAEEAELQGKPLQDHWAHMTIHGTLHLLGFDHMEAWEAEEMEQLERDILYPLGISDPYAIERTK